MNFQLEEQIKFEENELSKLDRELDEIEQNLSLSKASDINDIHVLVQKVRKCLHDDIQRLHGTMPLLGVDHSDDANSLVLVKLMRIKLNEILHKSKKIQQLLTWVNKKSLQFDQSINPNYSRLRASIRAFYCANTFDRALNLNRTTDYTGDCANALAETLNPNFSLSHIFSIALDCEGKSILDYNLVLDRALTGILTLAIDINEQLSVDPNWLNTNLYLSTLASCFNDILTNKFIFCKPNSELEQSLENLKIELPRQYSQ